MVPFTFKETLRSRALSCQTCCGPGVLHGTAHVQGNTAVQGRYRVQGCYHVQHGAVHVQGNTAVQGCYHVQHTFTLKRILRSRGTTMSNMRSLSREYCPPRATMSNMLPFTFKGILRSRNPTWYPSRSRKYCSPGVLPCPT